MAENKTSGGYTSLGDYFDGGGPGQSGDTFGGAFGDVSNAFGATPYGSGREPTGVAGRADRAFRGDDGNYPGGYTSLGDMFDRGGPGASGGEFKGTLSPISNFASDAYGAVAGVIPTTVRDGAASFGATAIPGRSAGMGGDDYNSADFMSPAMAAAPSAAEPAMSAPPPELVQWLANKNTFGSLSDWIAAYPVSFGSAMDYLSGDDVSKYNKERSEVPEFAEGGYVGPGGQPIRPNAPPAPMGVGVQTGQNPQGGMSFPQIEAQVQQFIQSNPQAVQQIQQEVQAGLMSGELTPDALNMFVQVATVALQNPQMYPQIRQYLLENDFLDEEDMPLDYVQGYALILHMIGKVAEQVASGQMAMPMAAPGGQPQMPMAAPGGQMAMPMAAPGGQPQMSMREGGPLPERSPKPDGSIPINAHEGEYVIPKNVVRAKGTEFFDKLLQQYSDRDSD
jgi:hypothetical protein